MSGSALGKVMTNRRAGKNQGADERPMSTLSVSSRK